MCPCIARAQRFVRNLCVRFIPPLWQPAPYQTTGDLELWRGSLRALGTELAVISVSSFACKAVLVALRYSEILDEGSSLYLSLSTLLVEALPTLLTIALLIRYHGRSIHAERDSHFSSHIEMGNLGTSLLRDGSQSRTS